MVAYDMTAAMETQLDEVSKGQRTWNSVLSDAWTRYADRYSAVMATPRAAATADAPVRLANKVDFGDAVDHQVGAYKIKRGPYGLYMFKTGGKTKPVFVGIPDTTPYATLTPEGAEQLYKHCATAKKETKDTAPKKTRAKKE